MNILIARVLFCGILCGTVCANFAIAAEQDPYKIVQETTEQVLAVAKDAKGNYEKDSVRYNAQVTAIMDKVVDFDGFARGVMGIYASKQRYQALSNEVEKAKFQERIQRFSAVFKKGVVDTYGSSLFSFNSEKIETLPPRKGDDPATGSVSVLQNIYGASGKPYTVQYSMRRNKEGEWKLLNVIVEGINLGLTYHNQFTASVDKYNGDLEKVIANWSVEVQATGATHTEPAKDTLSSSKSSVSK